MIKKIFSFSLIALMFTLVACGGGSDEDKITATVENFYAATADGDMEGMKEYMTEDGQQLISLVETMMSAEEIEAAFAGAGEEEFNITVTDIVIDGDNATCMVSDNNDAEKPAEEMQLKKVDGDWLIHMSKEDKEGM
ncbi:MAG: nuclear transport factor 2 family protein [Chitinophagales bacterium]